MRPASYFAFLYIDESWGKCTKVFLTTPQQSLVDCGFEKLHTSVRRFFVSHTHSLRWYMMKRSVFFERLDRAVEAYQKGINDSRRVCVEARSLRSVVACAIGAELLPPGSKATEENPIVKLICHIEGPMRDRRYDNMTRTEYRLNERAWDFFVKQYRFLWPIRRLLVEASMALAIRWPKIRSVLASAGM